ncbi:MAG TPA: DUF5916 domain-containing protein [Vicinamibacterales bacterium]|nr:DUF5916 domain-containing protein [Vicinamibacterales bacterium]
MRDVRVYVKVLALAASVHLAIPAPALCQTKAHVELRPTLVTVPPKVDGILDDEAWTRTAPLPLDGWMSYNPMRGEAAAEKTQVWMAYDEQAIYFAFRCLDSEPNRIRTTISRRDNAFGDDWVGLSLDSSRAGQLAYHLFVNPSGIQMDALQSGTTGEDLAPDWVWQSAGRVDAEGWSAEIRVPIENIRFRSGTDVHMGVLFWRRLSRSGVSTSWPEMRPGQWVFESNAEVVFDNLKSRRLLEVIPSATVSGNQGRQDAARWNSMRGKGDFGASVKYGLTSAITLDATINPDFSQVESDAFEIEVNQRFPIFFSEKRPFFMEGLGLFNLAGTNGDATMRTAVHTRRIIDPSAGIKVTGSGGKHTFGLLSSADVSPEGSRQRVFTVAREVMNFGQGQYVGLLLTDTEHGTDYNRVAGGDVAFKNGEHLRVNGSFLASRSRSLTGERTKGNGFQSSYSYDTQRFTIAGQGEHYDRGFRMDTAFVNRVGLTRGWQYVDLNFYPSHPRYRWTKRINSFFWISGAKDREHGGTEIFYLPGIRFHFTRAGFLRVDYGNGHETFAGRQFDVGRMMADGNVQIKRWLNIGGGAQKGPAIFYDEAAPFQGYSRSINLRIGFQPSSRVNNNTSYSFETFNNRATGLNVYRVHIINMRNTYQFSPRFFVRGVTQFDSSRRRVLADFLASYELSPGTVVHAGYGSLFGRAHEDLEFDRYRATARALFFKASYRARF